MNLPNKISLTRIILIPFFIAAYMLSGLWEGALAGDILIYVSAGIFAAASFTDFLDGRIARKRGLVTDVGNFLDTVADKVLVVSALVLIAGFGLVPAVPGVIIAVIIIGRELAVLALKMAASGKNVIIVADKLGKVKAFLQMAAVTAVLPAKPLDAAIGVKVPFAGAETGWVSIVGFALLAAAALLTLVSAVNYFVRNRKVFTADGGNNKAQP